MKRTLKIISFLMALILVLSGCTNNDEDKVETPEFVYSSKLVELPDNLDDINQITYKNSKLYFNGYIIDEEQGHMTAIGTMNPDGTELTVINLPKSDNENKHINVNSLTPSSDGNIWLAVEEGYYDEEKEEYLSENFLMKIDQNGNELKKVSLYSNARGETASAILAAAAATDYFYVNKILTDSQDNIYLQSDSMIYVFDKDANLLFEVGDDSGNSWISCMQLSSDGSMYVSIHGRGDSEFRKIDLETKKFSEPITLPESLKYISELFYGPDYDIYINNGSALLGVDFEGNTATEPVEIFNWIDSDIDSSNINNILCLENDTYLVSGWDSNWNTELNIVTKQKYEESEKEIITLGTLSYGNIKSAVVKFNKTNDKYRIKLKEYDVGNYENAINAINTDIVTGNAPDIIELNALSADNYIAKGLLEDLYPYFDNDADISSEDYVQSVLKAFEKDGKLYSFTPSFSIMSVLGRSSVVGDEPGWNLDDLYAALETQPEGTVAFANATKMEMLSAMCMMNIDEFIDYSTGKCYFDSEEFIDLLEFSNHFEDNVDYSSEDYESELTQVYNGKAMLYPINIYQIEDFQFAKAVLGDDLTFIGFPSEDSSGTVMSPTGIYGISSKSKHKEGAWTFLKTLLTDDYQSDRNSIWSFPIKNSVLDDMFEEAMTPSYYTDENGNQVESPKMGMGMDDFMVDIMAATQEEIDELKALIDSISSIYNTQNTSVLDLISEDASAFFEGQKSAKDVASVIQNRVQTYINESR